MRTNKDQFMKDFEVELQGGFLNITDELTPETIFILEDGTCINAEYGYGERLTDHSIVLMTEGYDMEHLVTIEPESTTIILPDNETTIEQDQTLLDLDQVYNSYDIQVEYSSAGHIEQAVIMYLLEAGASWGTAYLTGVQHEYTEYSVDEFDQLDDLEKEELFVINDNIIVEFW